MSVVATKSDKASAGVAPADQLKSAVQGLAGAVGQRAVSSASNWIDSTTSRLTDYAAGKGGSLREAVTGGSKAADDGPAMVERISTSAADGLGRAGTATKDKAVGVGKTVGNALGLGGGKEGGGQLKVTNIVEDIDIGASREVVYNQWTQFTDFPRMTKKVGNVEQSADEKETWTARILWSDRTWESTIIDQVPDERIIWQSTGEKGYVDGAVTFHALSPDLTRVVLVLNYHPKGLFEHVGNIWRAQGRRARLELKHFKRHVMTQILHHPEEVEGWRGEIHDGEVASQGNGDGSAGKSRSNRSASGDGGSGKAPQRKKKSTRSNA